MKTCLWKEYVVASFKLLDVQYVIAFKSPLCLDLTDATGLEWLIKLHSAVKKKKTRSKLGKEYYKTVYGHPCLFNSYAEYIMWNARLVEAQDGIMIAGRTFNNLRYADDTTIMIRREEKLKSLLMEVKEESEKAGLKLNSQKTEIVASGPIT